MDSLDNAGTVKLMNGLPDFCSICRCIYQFGLSCAGYPDLHIFVNITICMTGDGNGLLPGIYIRNDALYKDGGTEYGAV